MDELILKEEEDMANEPQTDTSEPEIEFLDLPYLETVETGDEASVYPEVDAYWFLLFPEYKVYRFDYLSDQEKEDDQEIEYTERFRPILLIHGFKSTYSTWNWMAQRLWADGYRNIFAMELFSYTSGFPKLFEQLNNAIDQILSMLEKFDFVHLIGHSMGGMVSRYYLKQEIESKVRFCMTLGSPHYGVFNILKPFADLIYVMTKSFIPSQMDIVKNFSPKGRMVKINEVIDEEDVYKLTMVNLMGQLPLVGTDGLFKPKPIHDMVNIRVPANHFMVNKTEASYQVIRGFLFNRTKVFKLRLLYVKIPKSKEAGDKKYYFKIDQEDKPSQRYPISGFIELNDHILIPKEPLIIYVGMSQNPENDEIEIQVFERKVLQDLAIIDQKISIPLGSTEKVFDSIVLTAPTEKTKFVLAIVSYKLEHTY
jgi:pimeloyl-ACP methyl ester carboxylesterase